VTPAGRRLAVLDIDGVLADVRHRLHHLRSRPKDWDAFFAAAPLDPPLPQGVDLAARLAEGHDIAYVTGRPSRCREDTLRWLREHGLPDGRLLTRPGGDFRASHVTKLELLRGLERDAEVALVVDDDDRVVRTLTRHGYTVLHATWGDPGADGDEDAAQALRSAQQEDGRT
jgi:phosphoglycolate phosphatase-like HAD superfamily hydrolase